jgi:hypothetical protein
LAFDPAKRLPPVTIGALIRDAMKLEVHCQKCGDGRFRCKTLQIEGDSRAAELLPLALNLPLTDW